MKKSLYPSALFVLVLLVWLRPGFVLGDGGFVAPPWSSLYEPVQQALLEYDRETRTEKLSIQPAFYGDARAFAWIVPVPDLPEVALADRRLFRDLDTLTRPVYRSRDGDWDCFEDRTVYSPEPATDTVEIISEEMVGYYQTLILAATEAPALLDFLTDLGFLHDYNRENVTAAIEDYVARSWFFVAMEVDSTALAEIHPGGFHPYYGQLDPIELTFASATPVYPLKISAISAADDSRVHLYVKADHRMTFPGADTWYANRFSWEELEEITGLPSLRPVLQPGDFLTKLHRGYRPDQMTADLTLERAPTDHEFHQVNYGGFPWTGALLLSLPLAAALKRRFWKGG